MDRLTAEDQRMLWPDELWPQDIGVLAILDGMLVPELVTEVARDEGFLA